MLREALQHTIETAVAALVREGRLPAAVAEVPVEISDTKSPDHGDYACNFAMAAAKKAGMNPRALGEMLKEVLISGEGSPWSEERTEGWLRAPAWKTVGEGVGSEASTIHNPQSTIREVDVAGPGFLNLRLHPEAVAAYVPKILDQGEAFGHLKQAEPGRINVEFVSVNPNGPITIGSGRGAAFGSALANVLQAAGNVVHREYYINDGVNSEQMRQFSESVRELANGRPVPEKGYRGEYVEQVAKEIAMGFGKRDGSGAPFFSDYWAKTDAVLSEIAEGSPWWPDAIWWAFYVAQVQGGAHIGGGLGKDWFGLSVNATSHHCKASEWTGGEVTDATFRDLVERMDRLGKRLSVSSPDLSLEVVRGEPQPSYRVVGALELSQYWFRIASQEMMVERQRGDLAHFGVVFDTWFSEQSLHDQGVVLDRIERLKRTGVADEEPYRIKLKLGKGGAVEETIREEQFDENEGSEDEAPTPEQPESTVHNPQSATLWLRSTKFGDDMDRVLRRRDGRLTYIASDVAYHENKLTRPEGATKLITILGPDHHGYIGRLTAVMAALLRGPEDTPEANAHALTLAKERLEVVIYQLVRFLKDGKPAPMRKRDGNIYELRDLIDELGKSLHPDGTDDERRTTGRDVARFFYLMRSQDTTMDFDIDLATQQSDENPVFYAQYAHARICSVLRKAEESPSPSGSSWRGGQGGEAGVDYALLVHPRETALVKKILDLPWEVGRVAKDYGVHRLATYAVELARTYHHFYDACRVIQPDEPALTQARLALCRATRVALHATFELLGVSSPERLDRREAA